MKGMTTSLAIKIDKKILLVKKKMIISLPIKISNIGRFSNLKI
jgi:hypothetical protein